MSIRVGEKVIVRDGKLRGVVKDITDYPDGTITYLIALEPKYVSRMQQELEVYD